MLENESYDCLSCFCAVARIESIDVSKIAALDDNRLLQINLNSAARPEDFYPSPKATMAFYKETFSVCLLGLLASTLGLTLDALPHRLQGSSGHEHRQQGILHPDFGSGFAHDAHTKRKVPDMPGMSHSPPKSALFFHDELKKSAFEGGYPTLHNFREHAKIKRKAEENGGKKDKEELGREELANILKDDDSDKSTLRRVRKIPPDTKRQESLKKKKRESDEAPEPLPTPMQEVKPKQKEEKHNDFQEWLRKEYYRNMARSFASMRRKRAMWGPMESEPRADNEDDDEDEEEEEEEMERRRFLSKIRAEKMTTPTRKENRFDEVTSNLKSIEDALLADALHVVKGGGDSYEGDYHRRQRVSNDLNAAYDIETMRSALFRLRDTLYSMEDEATPEEQGLEAYAKHKKRSGQCAPLNVLTSDCAVLGDIVPDDSLKNLLMQACNWHEVCYSCGEVFGLSSDNCDMGFVEQSRTICSGDVPCETTARLLLLPLRQRRVFYKRSNPSVCLVDPCVEEFLTRDYP